MIRGQRERERERERESTDFYVGPQLDGCEVRGGETQRVFDLRQEKVNLATVAEFFKGAIFLVILRTVYFFVLFYVI